jgi:hypothetical protein
MEGCSMIRKTLIALIILSIIILNIINSNAQETVLIQLRGQLQMLIINEMDRAEVSKSRIVHYLKTEDGNYYQIEDPNGIVKIKAGIEVIISGTKVNNKLIADKVTSLDYSLKSGQTEGDVSNETGEQRTLVALFNYPDKTGQPLTLQDVQNRVINNPDSVDKFIRENSYDNVWFYADFVNWNTLPNGFTYYTNNYWELLNDSIKTLDSQVNFSNYTRLIFFYIEGELGFPGCASYVGKGTLYSPSKGNFTASVSFISGYNMGCASTPRIAHEFGHQLGFLHAASVVCANDPYFLPKSLIDPAEPNDSCHGNYSSGIYWTYFEYGDNHDSMGNDGYYRLFSSIWKSRAGWVENTQIQDTYFSNDYIIDQIELPSNGMKALRIPLGKDLDRQEVYYWLEYRRKLGIFDTFNLGTIFDIPDQVQIRIKTYGAYDGIQQWRSDNSMRFVKDVYDDAHDIDINKSFLDPYRGLKIELIERTGNGSDSKAKLRVTRSGVKINPEYALNFGNIQKNNIYAKNVIILNNSNSPVTFNTISIIGRDAALFHLETDSCSSKTVQPSTSCTLRVSLTSNTEGKKFGILYVPSDDILRPKGTIGLYANSQTSPLPLAPTVTTNPATKMTQHSATLNGSVNPNWLSTSYYFEWGTTTSYGKTTIIQSVGNGGDDVIVSANLTGLTLNTIYHYRLVAVNSAGTTYGSDMTFKTSNNAMPWLMLLLGD